MNSTIARLLLVAPLLAAPLATPAATMTLEVDGVPAVQLTAFTTAASNTQSSTGGGAGVGKASLANFAFSAPQSAATPALMKLLIQGRHAPAARVQIRSLDTGRVVSQWDLSEVIVSTLSVTSGEVDPKSKAADLNYLPPDTTFSLGFAKYCYKTFATDGVTVSSQFCYNLSTTEIN